MQFEYYPVHLDQQQNSQNSISLKHSCNLSNFDQMNNGWTPGIPPPSRGGRRPGNQAGDYLHAQTATPPTASGAMMADYLHVAPPTPRTTSRAPGRARQPHVPRPLNLTPDGLRHYELVTIADVLMSTGDWAVLPRALISSDWEQGGVMAGLAEATGHRIFTFPSDPAGWIVTPRGRIPYRRALYLGINLRGLTLLPELVFLPVLETEVAGHLGISLALGRPFINAYFGDDWPPPNRVQPQAGLVDPTFPGTVWEGVPAGGFSVANPPMSMANVPAAAPHTPTVALPFSGNERLNSWLSDMYPPHQEE